MRKPSQHSSQVQHYFTQADQMSQLIGASEVDADIGFMARLLAGSSSFRSDMPLFFNPSNPYLALGQVLAWETQNGPKRAPKWRQRNLFGRRLKPFFVGG